MLSFAGIIPLAVFEINGFTFLLLLVSIGLVVDYCLHVIASFFFYKSQKMNLSSRDERAEAALVEIGGSALLGGFSTLQGVIVMAVFQCPLLDLLRPYCSNMTLGLIYVLLS